MKAACNLGDILDAPSVGDRLALIDCRDWAKPESLTYGKIDALANACARGLAKRGLRRGSTVGILSGNRAEYLVAYLGIMRAGLVAVPVNFRFPSDTIHYILRDARIEFVFFDAPSRAVLPTTIPGVDFDDPGPGGFEALLDRGPFEVVRPETGETAMILYTSGSSGRPKGVLLSHEGQLWAVGHRVRAGSFGHERLLIAAPLFHMNGLGTAKFAFAAGASVVLLPRFEARRYIEAARRFQCTWLTGVPTMYALIMKERGALEDADFSFVKYVRMGSAPATQGLIDAVKSSFPRARISLSYGTTESGPVAFGPHPQGHPKPDQALGWPARGVEVRFATEAMEAAREGVLQIRTPAMMTGYLNLPEKTREVLSPDGWYMTGDVFRRSADGCYSFVGRADDMINCGGENIYPAEVEALLTAHPAIADASVVGIADEIKGEKPVAFVVLKPGAHVTEDEVKRYVLDHAPAFQHPRRVKFMAELPLAGTNKVDRNALRRLAEREWSSVS
ncbi:MAG TPA: class I adenylate-forming enzyme family protein [Stellaceae bacterium]|nr:class I adenylate-forming enzyme family protein [Stellaceae bacterium]